VPTSPAAYPPAVDAILAADLVLLGPGSLYTSILPNLLFPELARALRATAAPVVLIQNLMTQPGETDGLSAVAHLAAIESHVGPGLVDAVLVHDGDLPGDRLAPYLAEGAEPVPVDRVAIAARGVRVVAADLLAAGALIRHDPDKLARATLALSAGRR
jgi:uncharacterized cofD-like protein